MSEGEDVSYAEDLAATVMQFRLSPDVPDEEKESFRKFMVMFSRTVALANIAKEDIMKFLITKDIIVMAYEDGLYDYAHELQADYLQQLQLSRAVGGFETLYGQHGVQRTESLEKTMGMAPKRKKTWGGKIAGLFKGKKPEEESESE